MIISSRNGRFLGKILEIKTYHRTDWNLEKPMALVEIKEVV